MTPQSAKNKGWLGQKEVIERISQISEFGLSEGDLISRSRGSQGEDIIMSPLAQNRLYFDDWEVKWYSKVRVCRWMDQVVKRKSKKPVVCFRENRGDWYAMVRLDDLLNILAQLEHKT